MARHRLLAAAGAWTLLAVIAAGPATAAQVWSGRTFAFAKAAFADYTLAENQDRITPTVWITRASLQGLFNAKTETAYTGDLSPADTEWATGDAANHGNLAFLPWEVWANRDPPATVGVNAVVHLISDDLYIDIVFTSWGQGLAGGGAFSYRRAVDPGVTPAQGTTWGRIKVLFR
jgi:hypothetical protein